MTVMIPNGPKDRKYPSMVYVSIIEMVEEICANR